MADYLSKLAGRALGVEPVAQPFVAPMYAPGPELLAGAPDGTAHDVESVAEDDAEAPSAPADLPAALVPSLEPEPPKQPVVVRTQAGPRELAVEQWVEGEGIAEEEMPLEPTGRSRARQLAVSGDPPASPRASRDQPRSASPPEHAEQEPDSAGDGELPAPRAARAAQPAPRQKEIVLPRGLPADEAEPAALVLPMSAPLAGEESAAGGPLAGEESVAGGPLPVRVEVREAAAPWPAAPGPPGADELDHREQEEPGEPPESAIRITIGRVEVRAVMRTPPKPAPAESPAPPRLSLDEYLRSEIGGSR
jgi:hypothetical protein